MKKRLKHPKADDVLRQDFAWQLACYQQNSRPIVYLDESGFKTDAYRPYAYAKKGQACYDTDNWQAKNQTNAIGAIHNNQLFAVGLYECSINSRVFLSWVEEQLLMPQLPKNSVIVMDNATFHKRQDIQDTIIQNGHTILFYGYHLIHLI